MIIDREPLSSITGIRREQSPKDFTAADNEDNSTL